MLRRQTKSLLLRWTIASTDPVACRAARFRRARQAFLTQGSNPCSHDAIYSAQPPPVASSRHPAPCSLLGHAAPLPATRESLKSPVTPLTSRRPQRRRDWRPLRPCHHHQRNAARTTHPVPRRRKGDPQGQQYTRRGHIDPLARASRTVSHGRRTRGLFLVSSRSRRSPMSSRSAERHLLVPLALGLAEQMGHYGPLIIDPAGDDPVQADRSMCSSVRLELRTPAQGVCAPEGCGRL